MFKTFSEAVHARYNEMAKRELFVVDVLDIFDNYLAAFPEGTNPIFRERTEHDCNCCKQFIRKLGVLVAIDDDGDIMSVWDVDAPYPYNVVATALGDLVRQAPILRVFRSKDRQFGQAQNFDTHTNQAWNHFHGRVADKHYSPKPGEDIGGLAAAAQVFRRGLDELTTEALDTVAELIKENQLYRGEEHKRALEAFRKMHKAYQTTPNRELFAWANLNNPAARFRNTVIGTLVVDLSNNVELDKAVRSFEAKVAPANYKRPKAVISQRMIDDAVTTLEELGLEQAVERRFAKISDVTINNVLWADRSTAPKMKGGLRDMLASSAKSSPVKVEKATPISADAFLADILPTATSMQVLVENSQLGNFMSLTAPVHESTGRLFKWDNDFAWSYDGEVADSIAEKVKRAGGATDVPLRVSLAWHNGDDLDIHAQAPEGHIYYHNRCGVLDVDTNGMDKMNKIDPVENLAWRRPRDGRYQIAVHQFSKRDSRDPGFTIELWANGESQFYTYTPEVRTGFNVNVLTFRVKDGKVSEVVVAPELKASNNATEKWGVKTQQLVPVETVMLSPNYWDGQGVGNRHLFFMLKGCKNPDATRGIYNEFLRADLDKHRKVFEVLGSKAKCPPSDEQLSGVGFSSTKSDKVTVVVNNRTYQIQF